MKMGKSWGGVGRLGRQMPGEPAHLALMPPASISLNNACIHSERVRVIGPHLQKNGGLFNDIQC